MSDYKPITGELRGVMFITESEQGTPMVKLGWFRFKQLCDAIDAVHAQLERENTELKAKLDRVTGEQEEHTHVRGESITDELRGYAEDWDWLDTGAERAQDRIEAIADRIDAEHERLMRERKGCIHYDQERHYCNVHDLTTDEHYQLLPKDADGEYIHIGDRMEWVRYKDDDPTVVRTVSGIGNGVFFAWSDEQGRYAQYEAHAYRHHHAPTVEDVLREFALKVAGEECMTMRTGVVEEFAAKLRLAESEDA